MNVQNTNFKFEEEGILITPKIKACRRSNLISFEFLKGRSKTDSGKTKINRPFGQFRRSKKSKISKFRTTYGFCLHFTNSNDATFSAQLTFKTTELLCAPMR